MHEGELTITDEVVRWMVDEQFPHWAARPLTRLPPLGTDNQLFRLGDDLLVRMPRIDWAAAAAESEHRWLPLLAAHLTTRIPVPVGLGEPSDGYPWHWTVVPWIEGHNPVVEPDRPGSWEPGEWAVTLGAVVRELHGVPALGGPVRTEGRGGPLEALDEWVRTWTARADPTEVDRDAVLTLWEDALAPPAWDGGPVWLHTDPRSCLETVRALVASL